MVCSNNVIFSGQYIFKMMVQIFIDMRRYLRHICKCKSCYKKLIGMYINTYRQLYTQKKKKKAQEDICQKVKCW